MRKVTYAFIIILGTLFFITSNAEAQTVTAGGGVGYGSKSENANFQVNLYYRLPTLPLRIGGDVGFSKPEDNLTEIESNANLHFMAVDTDLLSLYTITGLNVLHARFSPEVGETFSDTDTGFNLGAGAELDLGFGRAFGEAKYILGTEREEQVVLGAGIRVSLSN
jgi:opacity protein-like surface antigen